MFPNVHSQDGGFRRCSRQFMHNPGRHRLVATSQIRNRFTRNKWHAIYGRETGYNGTVLSLFFLLALVAPFTETLDKIHSARSQHRFPEALEHLDRIKAKYPDLYLLNNLPYLEYVLLQQAGRLPQAVDGFRFLLNSDFPLQDFLLLHLVESTEGQPLEQRRPYFDDFLSRYGDHPHWPAVALQYAEQWEKAHRLEEALLWYDRLSRKRRTSHARTGGLRKAFIFLKTGRKGIAIRTLRQLIEQKNSDDVAYGAAQELHRLQPLHTLDEHAVRRRAHIFLSNRRTLVARKYLRHLIRRFPESPSRDEYSYWWARSWVIDSDFRKSIQAYEDSYQKSPHSHWGIFSKYATGNMYLRLEDYARAAAVYRYIIERHSDSEYADNAYFNLADAHRWLGQRKEAEEILQKALAQLPKNEHGQFRYSLARLYLEKGNWIEALARLTRLDHLSSTELPAGVTREEIFFWKGLCLEKMGQKKRAVAAYQEASRGSPNYFAYVARFRLPENESATRPEGRQNQKSPNWNNALLKPRPLSLSTSDKSPDESTSSPTARVRELLFLRLSDEAYWEMKRHKASAFSMNTTDYFFNLAYFANLANLPGESIRAADRLSRLSFPRMAPEFYPEAVRRLLYPRHYWDLVERFSAKYHLDPALLLAVMHQESRFQSQAKSRAAARGLMQLLTSTARRLASQLEVGKIQDSDLYKPELSIELGAYYLSQLLSTFHGSLEKALAAYNGGSENTRRWAKKSPATEPEIFVANIGFRETKLYVLKVMGNYHAYRTIYTDR